MPKILVIDDSAVDRRLAGGLLEKAGEDLPDVQVIYAPNGKEALITIARESPDLVLTDLQMPEMNGLEVVEEIKRRHASIPVILMTAHVFESMNMLRLFALPFADNTGSVRVLEKAGYVREAILRSSSVKYGQPRDQLLYARVNEGWRGVSP